jgi:hypothetical protein
MEKKKEYNISMKKGALIFSTTSFRAEEGSMLHSGIYSRELTSSLGAGAVIVAIALILVALEIKLTLPMLGVAVLMFLILMVLFRAYVFFEEHLKVTLDKTRGEIRLFKKALKNKEEVIPLDLLRSIRQGVTVLIPENQDGIAVVKKISAQHGMPIPGFGEPREYYSVVFEFFDERDIMVFSSEDSHEADAVLDMMKNFVGGQVAKAD